MKKDELRKKVKLLKLIVFCLIGYGAGNLVYVWMTGDFKTSSIMFFIGVVVGLVVAIYAMYLNTLPIET